MTRSQWVTTAGCAIFFVLLGGCVDPFESLCTTPSRATKRTEKSISPPEIDPAPPIKATEPEPSPTPSPKTTPPKLNPDVLVRTEAPMPGPTPTDPLVIALAPEFTHHKKRFKPVVMDQPEPAAHSIPTAIELIPLPTKAKLGEYVIAVARALDESGNPLAGVEVEWFVDRNGVGMIERVGGGTEDKEPAEVSSPLVARSRTSPSTYRLPTPSEVAETITIHPGEAWCILKSHAPGDMVLVARAPGVANFNKHRGQTRCHWFEAKLEGQPSMEVDAREPALVSFRVLNDADQPLTQYKVRLDIDGPEQVHFENRERSLELLSNSAGIVSTLLYSDSPRRSTCTVRASLWGAPVLPGSPTELDQRALEVAWNDRSPTLQVEAPPIAAVRQNVRIRAFITAPDRQSNETSNIYALVGDGVQVLHRPPENRSERAFQFTQAEAKSESLTAPKDTQDFERELVITSGEEGDRWIRVDVQQGDEVVASREVSVRFVKPRLLVEKRYPKAWKQGESATYQVTVKNVGEIAADQLTVEDELPDGLSARDPQAVRFQDRLRWSVDHLEPGEVRTFDIESTPTQGFDGLAVRTWAEPRGFDRFEGHDLLQVESVAPVEMPKPLPEELKPTGLETIEISIDDLVDPVKVDGQAQYLIHVVNRGSAPARNVVMICELSSELKPNQYEGTLAGRIIQNRVELGPIGALGPGQSVYGRLKLDAAGPGDARISVRAVHPILGSSGLIREESTTVFKSE